MPFKRKGLLVAMEDIAEDAAVTELTDVDEFNTVYADIIDGQEDLDVAFEAIKELERYQTVLTEISLTSTQARLLHIGLESINTRLGLSDPVPSLESYNNNELSVSLEEKKDNIFVAFYKWVKNLLTKIKDWIVKLFSRKKKLTNKIKETEEIIDKEPKKEEKEEKTELTEEEKKKKYKEAWDLGNKKYKEREFDEIYLEYADNKAWIDKIYLVKLFDWDGNFDHKDKIFNINEALIDFANRSYDFCEYILNEYLKNLSELNDEKLNEFGTSYGSGMKNFKDSLKSNPLHKSFEDNTNPNYFLILSQDMPGDRTLKLEFENRFSFKIFIEGDTRRNYNSSLPIPDKKDKLKIVTGYCHELSTLLSKLDERSLEIAKLYEKTVDKMETAFSNKELSEKEKEFLSSRKNTYIFFQLY